MDRAELRGMALTVISGIAMMVGIIMTFDTSSPSALCNTHISQLGRAFGSAEQARCLTYTAVHTSGVVLVILGIVGVLVGMGRLLGSSSRLLALGQAPDGAGGEDQAGGAEGSAGSAGSAGLTSTRAMRRPSS